MTNYLKDKSVTLDVHDENPAAILQLFIEKNYVIKNVRKRRVDHWRLTIIHPSIEQLIMDIDEWQIRKNIAIVGRESIYRSIISFLCRYEFMIAIICCLLLYMLWAQMIWKVEITGVSPESEYKMKQVLQEYKLVEGKNIKNIHNTAFIEQALLKKIPSLIYVGIENRGNNYYIEATEKAKQEESSKQTVKEIVAKKPGIIQYMFIQSGFPAVKKNERVDTGDLLITYEQTDSEGNKQKVFQTVDGKVYAETWYEIQLKKPVTTMYQTIKEVAYNSYRISINNFSFPIPTIQGRSKEGNHQEKSTHQLYFLKWPTPIVIEKTKHYQVDTRKEKEEVKDKKHVLIEQGLEQFRQNLGNDVEILMYDVLYDTIEKDEIKISLYVSVLEDIASTNE